MQMYYSVVAMQGADKIKIEDILSFPWEEKEVKAQELTLKTPEETKAFWETVDKKKQQ
tara:strand:- start:1059 stop:1232 length:174 start_codon:yes stop_codon:yes gene_type:complete